MNYLILAIVIGKELKQKILEKTVLLWSISRNKLKSIIYL